MVHTNTQDPHVRAAVFESKALDHIAQPSQPCAQAHKDAVHSRRMVE